MKKIHTTKISLSVVIIFLAMAAAGTVWVLLRTIASVNDTNSNASSASNQVVNNYKVTDFDTCVAAGNPVMETYPERCMHKGVSYTANNANSTQQIEGTKVTSSGNVYSMVVPKGMKLLRDMSSDIFRSTELKQSSLTDNPTAEVVDVGSTAGDGGAIFFIILPGENGVSEPEGQGSPITLGTATGMKYVMRYTADTERGLGQRDKGDVMIDYRLTLDNGTAVVAWYNIFASDPVDNTALIESMLATLQPVRN